MLKLTCLPIKTFALSLLDTTLKSLHSMEHFNLVVFPRLVFEGSFIRLSYCHGSEHITFQKFSGDLRFGVLGSLQNKSGTVLLNWLIFLFLDHAAMDEGPNNMLSRAAAPWGNSCSKRGEVES